MQRRAVRELRAVTAAQEFACVACHDTGHVCENHPSHPWAPLAGGEECCGGAGMPCPACCSPVPEDGSHRVGEAFTPDWLRP